MSLIAELMTVGILAVGLFGVAFLIGSAVRGDLGSIGLAEAGLIPAVVAVTVLLWRGPRARLAVDVAPAASPERIA